MRGPDDHTGSLFSYVDSEARVPADHPLRPIRGERKINEAKAETVRRIFREFAAGTSPRAIARRLNEDGVPAPSAGKLWTDSSLRGRAGRGTGIVNNELYIGRLVWNRQRFMKNPETGKRVARINPPDDWIVTEVPELRIVDDALWQAAKDRQGAISIAGGSHRKPSSLRTGLRTAPGTTVRRSAVGSVLRTACSELVPWAARGSGRSIAATASTSQAAPANVPKTRIERQPHRTRWRGLRVHTCRIGDACHPPGSVRRRESPYTSRIPPSCAENPLEKRTC